MEEHSPDDRELRHKFIKEVRRAAEQEPQTDWNLICVLAGPEKKVFDSDVDGTGRLNETRTRFETGLCLVREVTARRLLKPASELTLEEIRSSGPLLYFAGLDPQQQELVGLNEQKRFDIDYGVPAENIRIEKRPDIKFTWQQFAYFPKQLIPDNGKIVIVSSGYHIPRIKDISLREKFDTEDGYLENPMPSSQLVLYASAPVPYGLVKSEIEKFPVLHEQGRSSSHFFDNEEK